MFSYVSVVVGASGSIWNIYVIETKNLSDHIL